MVRVVEGGNYTTLGTTLFAEKNCIQQSVRISKSLVIYTPLKKQGLQKKYRFVTFDVRLNVKLLVQFGLNVHLLHCHNMGKVYQNPFCLKNYLISQSASLNS